MAKAKTEILGTGVSQIPTVAIRKIGSIFIEGQKKYGRDNWKLGTGDKDYQLERLEHALEHFLNAKDLLTGDTEMTSREEVAIQLAKVAWFCVTEIYHLNEEEREEFEVPPAQCNEYQ